MDVPFHAQAQLVHVAEVEHCLDEITVVTSIQKDPQEMLHH